MPSGAVKLAIVGAFPFRSGTTGWAHVPRQQSLAFETFNSVSHTVEPHESSFSSLPEFQRIVRCQNARFIDRWVRLRWATKNGWSRPDSHLQVPSVQRILQRSLLHPLQQGDGPRFIGLRKPVGEFGVTAGSEANLSKVVLAN